VEQDDKGWDARKRAYCLKIQPATGSFARNLIYSTKPSHVRNYASGEWLTLINEANLIVDNLITDKLPLEFSSWVARMRTPEALVDAIRIYQQSASTEVRTYFALQNDGFFTSDIIMVDAHKAA
ncbi:hypothetical protein UXZ76_18675, partial [Escherichia coli]|nr:hypothetical protein [Escherichia coli]MDY8085659.1 hypothetical protein [Escherichia coli]MDY8129204.1 hypothetical protein [Escherichia coli]MDY8940836.1 hypothetical protein [Escherichia coli]